MINPETIIYLVRHAQAYSDKTDIPDLTHANPLTPEGMRRAHALGSSFQSVPLAAIFASDIPRALKTAEVIAESVHLPVKVIKDLRERRWGTLETQDEQDTQRIVAEYQHMDPAKRFRLKLVPDMETDEEQLNRVYSFFDQMANEYPGKTVLAVSHSYLMTTLLVSLKFAKFNELGKDKIENGAYIKLVIAGKNIHILETKGITNKNMRLPIMAELHLERD